jgi:hypothetical protein
MTVEEGVDMQDKERENREPSLAQKLHSATGDRDAEAAALEERADVTEEEAQHEVRKAAGDFEEPAAPGNIARPADVEPEHGERDD